MNFEEKSMLNIEKNQQNPQQLKPYCSPHIEKLGDLRSLTLGVSGGTGESGNALLHYIPPPLDMPPFGG